MIVNYGSDSQTENRSCPRRYVQVQSAQLQIVALPIVDRVIDQILKPPFAIPKIIERQPNVALALVRGIAHSHQQATSIRVLPGKS
jgi:hypothetical protein